MSGQHTQGRLVVEPQPGGGRLFNVSMDGIFFGQSLTIEAARRLAACWNACDGLTTEQVGMTEVLSLLLQHHNARRTLDKARALLIGILQEAEGWHDECWGTPLESGIAEEVRAFLKGGE